MAFCKGAGTRQDWGMVWEGWSPSAATKDKKPQPSSNLSWCHQSPIQQGLFLECVPIAFQTYIVRFKHVGPICLHGIEFVGLMVKWVATKDC